MLEETVVENRPTRRAAAKRAAGLAAEQLHSSPMRSEDERGHISFGEPSRPKAQVSVTYAGKRSKSSSNSPAKSSPSRPSTSMATPPQKRPIPALPLPRQPRARPAPSPRRTATKQGRGQKAARAYKVDVNPVSDSDSDDNDIELLDTPPTRFTANGKRGGTRLKVAGIDMATTPQKSKKRRLGTPPAHYLDDSGEESDLTPLPSPEPEDVGGSNGHATLNGKSAAGEDGEEVYRVPKDGDLVWVHLDAYGAIEASADAMWWPSKVTSVSPLRVRPFGHSPGISSTAAAPSLEIQTPSPRVLLSMGSRARRMRFDEKTFTTAGALENLAKSPRKRQRTEAADLERRWKEARDEMLLAYEDAHDGLPLLLSHYQGGSPTKPAFSESESEEEEEERMFTDPGPNPLWEIPGEVVLAKDKRTASQYWPAKIMRYVERRRPNDKEKYEVSYFDGDSKIIPREMILSPDDQGFATCKLGDSADNYGLDNDPPVDEAEDLSALSDEEPDESTVRSPSPAPTGEAFSTQLPISEQFAYTKQVLVALLNGQYLPARRLHIGFMKGGKSRDKVTSAAWKRGELSHRDKEELSTCIRRWMRRRGRRQALGVLAHDVSVDAEHIDQRLSAIDNEDALPPLNSQSTAGDTERALSSDAEGPPSSFVIESIVEDDNMSTDLEQKPSTETGPEGQANNELAAQQHVDVEDAHPKQAAHPLPTYAMLSGIDQITYCTCVLLPEAILQLLLWRNGLRETPAMLSHAEEETLHREAERLASDTYWVHELIFMKRSLERKTLPQYKEASVQEYSNSGRTRRSTRRG